VTIDPNGNHVWAVVRCDATDPKRFGDECLDSNLDSIVKFSHEGNVVASFGGGMFIWPHGIDVDAEGNVWVTDAVAPTRTQGGKRGHQVLKFSSDGKVLLTLGTPGVSGGGPAHFNAPSDVAVADNGDMFVADGHGLDGNNRVVKFSKDGKFIKAWGRTGYAPGEFRTLHAIAIDARGRVFVADRSNNRIQIFDQNGKFLTMWTQFGRPSGIFFDEKDQIYVADSESDDEQNPGWEMGIWIGDARTGWVQSFILNPWGDPRETAEKERSSSESIEPATCTQASRGRDDCRNMSGSGRSEGVTSRVGARPKQAIAVAAARARRTLLTRRSVAVVGALAPRARAARRQRTCGTREIEEPGQAAIEKLVANAKTKPTDWHSIATFRDAMAPWPRSRT
jgi:DNA-binding beta-propeller fold protein YncE